MKRPDRVSGLDSFWNQSLIRDFPRQDAIHGFFDAGKEGIYGRSRCTPCRGCHGRGYQSFIPPLKDELARRVENILSRRLWLAQTKRPEGHDGEINHKSNSTYSWIPGRKMAGQV